MYISHTAHKMKELINPAKDNYPKMVVSMDDFQGNTRNGIQHIRLIDFLSKDW
ncbi:hypothetical protein SDC9_103736 [bioreactor metagenome]|uniref:Uncharacterized protein n=1 Tax=bioreactor metagenome TaxID=1076179 RepID=A0A645AUZ8_9ZZZZ